MAIKPPKLIFIQVSVFGSAVSDSSRTKILHDKQNYCRRGEAARFCQHSAHLPGLSLLPAALYSVSTHSLTRVAPFMSCLAGPIDLLGWHQSCATGRNSSASQLTAAALYSLIGEKSGSQSDLRSSALAPSKQYPGRLWTVNKLPHRDQSLFSRLVKPDVLRQFASAQHQIEKSGR